METALMLAMKSLVRDKEVGFLMLVVVESAGGSRRGGIEISLWKDTEEDRSNNEAFLELVCWRSARTKQRHSVAPASPALKRVNKDTKPGVDTKQSVIFPLGPREHEWLVKCAAGQQDQICQLLLQDIKLAEKRNFISGFTVLHWAAKQGNSEIVRKILLLSQQGGPGVDVNIKSYDGYTPLHMAAIHSHESVLSVLVRDYGANCNIRDNSGKKPYQYLHKDASPK
ncbi:hypothetical protein P4O66_004326, partial [Electrophorus voltai]